MNKVNHNRTNHNHITLVNQKFITKDDSSDLGSLQIFNSAYISFLYFSPVINE